VLAMIGAGALAQTHLPALKRVRNLKEIGTSKQGGPEFAKQHGVTLASAQRANKVPTSWWRRLILKRRCGRQTACGALVCSVGAPRPTSARADDMTIARAGRHVCGIAQAALKDPATSSRPVASKPSARPQRCSPGPPTAEDIIIFKSLGMAVQTWPRPIWCAALGI
jgi:ornithine cyclodeaminase/alanine dehydrogenase-like protein (mu-crystallin family)